MAEFQIRTEIRPHGGNAFLVVLLRQRVDHPDETFDQVRLACSTEHAERLRRELSAKMEANLRKRGHRLTVPVPA
jgi:hypothetical protein